MNQIIKNQKNSKKNSSELEKRTHLVLPWFIKSLRTSIIMYNRIDIFICLQNEYFDNCLKAGNILFIIKSSERKRLLLQADYEIISYPFIPCPSSKYASATSKCQNWSIRKESAKVHQAITICCKTNILKIILVCATSRQCTPGYWWWKVGAPGSRLLGPSLNRPW